MKQVLYRTCNYVKNNGLSIGWKNQKYYHTNIYQFGHRMTEYLKIYTMNQKSGTKGNFFGSRHAISVHVGITSDNRFYTYQS